MQVQRKSAVFLIPGMLLFFGLSILLFNLPAQYPLIALLFFTFVLTTAVLVSLEMATVFGVLVTLIELGGVGVLKGQDKAWLAGHVVFLWGAISLIQRFSARETDAERTLNRTIQDRHETLVGLQKEKESLDKRLLDLRLVELRGVFIEKDMVDADLS